MSQIIDSIEYSVCEDCLVAIAHGETDHDISEATDRELNGRTGHFSPGVAQTEDDPDGAGYDEFSWRECELCRSTLGGSRHGVTLLITGDCPPTTDEGGVVMCEGGDLCTEEGIPLPAVRMMPQSTDGGETHRMVPCCANHVAGWWDGADWDGRHLEYDLQKAK